MGRARTSWRSRARSAAALSAVAVGIAVAGCGGSSHSTSTTATTTATSSHTTAQTPPAATGSPVVVASGIPFAANLAFDPQGGLWVASATLGYTPGQGIWYVPSGGRPRLVVTGLASATALTWIGNRLFVGNNPSPGSVQITAFSGFTGYSFKTREVVASGLSSGTHPIGTLVQGADGRLYTGLGAAGDYSGPPGHIVSLSPQGGLAKVEATGVGNVFGLAFWGPKLLATSPDPDHLGAVPARVLAFAPASGVANFGFPKCYGQGGPACAPYPAPLAELPAHSAPAGIVVKGDVAFVAENGSATPGFNAPSEIARIDLPTGKVTVFWRSPISHELVGLAIGPDGDLYATLFVSGKVVRFDL